MRASKIFLVGILIVASVFVGGLGCKKPDCSIQTGCAASAGFDTFFRFRYSNSGFTGSAKVGFNGVANYPFDPGFSGGKSCAIIPLGCQFVRTFFASPSSFNLNSPPATGAIYGSEISTTYGMPLVEYIDPEGVVAGQGTATEVAADGTWLNGPIPDLSSAYSGTYIVWVSNRNAGGSYAVIGVAEVTVTGRDYPPPTDCDNYPCLCSPIPCDY